MQILSMLSSLLGSGVPFVLLEASDGIGGRVRTDTVDGFLLDRGFAIFLTSYPEAKVRGSEREGPRAERQGFWDEDQLKSG